MDQANLVDDLAAWVEASHPTGGTRRNLHCSRIWKAVPGPSLGGVSVVSVRHQVPLVSRAPDLFVVELWDLRPGEIGDSDAARMCAQLAAYRAWYDEILEEAEIQGRGRRHRFSVHGNLVGASIGASPLIDVLSLHGREVAFWTCRRSEDGTDFLPHFGEERSTAPSPLSAMLDHLPWRAPPLKVQTSDDSKSDICTQPSAR